MGLFGPDSVPPNQLQIFKGYKVEVVTTGGLSPYIAPHILKDVEYVQIAN
jgi:predicted nucleotidyltransferase